MVPHYRLHSAQLALSEASAEAIPTAPFTFGGMREMFRRCKLYDYERHLWINFAGDVTGVTSSARCSERQPISRQPDAAAPAPGHFEPSAGIFFPSGEGSADEAAAGPASQENIAI
jgi:hypothetical protein